MDKTIGEIINDLKNMKLSSLLHTRLSGVSFWGAILVISFIWLMSSAIADILLFFILSAFMVIMSVGVIIALSVMTNGYSENEKSDYTAHILHTHEHYHYIEKITPHEAQIESYGDRRNRYIVINEQNKLPQPKKLISERKLLTRN